MDKRPPRDNLVRAVFPGAEVREEGSGLELVGYFAVFNEWARINSSFEGTFLERNAPGAFTKTIAENRGSLRVLLNHGHDPELGDKPIASIEEIDEDEIGVSYRASLLDGVPPLVVSGLRSGQYGSSYHFQVVRDEYVAKPKKSDYNLEGIPERTVKEARVFEFGPVTFPAYSSATAGVRSMTDEYVFDSLTADPARLRELIDHAAPSIDAGETHLDQERREQEPDPTPVPPPEPEVTPVSEGTKQYITLDEKRSRVRELNEGIKRHAEEPGMLLDAVQAEFDGMVAERSTLEAAITSQQNRIAQVRATGLDGQEDGFTAPVVNQINRMSAPDIYDLEKITQLSRSKDEFDQKVRDNAMRSVEAAVVPHPKVKQDEFRSGLEKFLDYKDSPDKEAARRILLTGSPVYRRAFNKYIGGQMLTPEEQRAAALAVTGTTTTGGYAVPYVFDPTFINIGAHTSVNPYRAACRVESITGGNNWRAVTSTAVVAAWNAEAAAETEQGPTIGQPTFTVQRASSFATVSIETLQDRPDIGDELTVLFQEAKDTLEENSFTLGVGTTVYPFGMFTTLAFTNKATATAGVTAIADMIALEAGLPLRHRANAAYFMSRSTQRQLEALDTGGYYFKRPSQQYALGSAIPQQSATGNTGSQLLGYPIWEVPSAVSTLTTPGAIIVVFGDPKNYVIVDRIGMNVEVIPNMLNGATPSFPTGQRGIFAMWRGTARPVNVDGMRSLSVQ